MSNQLLQTSSIITAHLRTDLPEFTVGSVISVSYKIKEGGKERIQVFKGLVTNIKGSKDMNSTFTVAKNSLIGIKVERTFSLHSPNIAKIEVETLQRARRSNLNKLYLETKDLAKSGRFKPVKALEKKEATPKKVIQETKTEEVAELVS